MGSTHGQVADHRDAPARPASRRCASGNCTGQVTAKLSATAAWPSSLVRARTPPLRDLNTFR